MSITMFDSITPSTVPGNAVAVAGYVDGNWPSFAGLVGRFGGRAHCLSITVLGGHAACLDIEAGNPVAPSQAGAWVRAMQRAGVWRPCIYAQQSMMPEIQASLRGLPRGSYRLWVAAWPGTGPNVPAGYDAHQYVDHGPHGENYDISVCRDDFFPAAKPKPRPSPKPHPKITAATIVGGIVTGIQAVLHAKGIAHWNPNPEEAGLITLAGAILAGYIKSSQP